jgi:hypothetical protein
VIKDHTFRNVFVRRDMNGRIVFDQCESDGEHLTRPLTEQEKMDRQRCRSYPDEAFESFVGRKMWIRVEVWALEEETESK